MGVLQLYLRPGKQRINIQNAIPKGNVTLKHVYASFNVEQHGFYLVNVDMPFLYQNNVQSNTNKRGVLIPVNHDDSVTNQEMSIRFGEVEIPKNFEVIVDLDSGHQVVIETDTRAGGPYAYKYTTSGLPSWNTVDYVLNPPGGAYVSLGLNADRVLDGTIANTSGVIDGARPFMYCMVLTLEYDEGIIEERLQQLLS